MDAIQCPVAQWAREAPDRIALKTVTRRISFGAWHGHINQLQSGLARHGVGAGDRVALVLGPGIDCLSLLVALFRLGAVACPINPAYPLAYRNELLGILDCSLLIGEAVDDRDFPVPCVDHDAWTERLDFCALRGENTGETPVPPFPQNFRPTVPDSHLAMTAAKAAAIIFTSGSSGPPKAAVLSLGNLLHNAWQSNSNIALTPGDTWLLSLPLHHVAGLGILFRCITAGAAIGLLSPADSLEDGARHTEATHFSLVARQLARLLDTEGGRAVLGRARAVLLGGSAIPGGLIAEGCRAHLPLFTSYGMTEMASQVTTTSPGASEEELGTSGRPLAPGVIRIGEDGLVQVNGPTRFLGYWQDGALHGPFDGDGWYRTGDRGHVDEKGNLHITGRADNMFVAGGENIQPEVIERALYEISGVRQAVVVPVPHPEFGAMPVAFVEDEQMRDGVEILEILRGQVPSFQVPRHLFPWPDEDTAGMKISRAAFAKKAATLLETG